MGNTRTDSGTGRMYASYGSYRCCIPGCVTYTYRRGNKLCSTHWKEYGGHKSKIPPWLAWLMLHAEREQYSYDRDKSRMVSLEYLVSVGQLNPHTMEIYRCPNIVKHRRRRGRPRKDGT